MAMKVSLCGPHSFETSTLGPTESDPVPPGEASGACVERYWYLSHQVGLVGSRAASTGNASASITAAVRMDICASGERRELHRSGGSRQFQLGRHAGRRPRASKKDDFRRPSGSAPAAAGAAALAARRGALAARRAAAGRARRVPAGLATAFRLTLAATGLVYRGRRDPLRRTGAAPAA